MRLNLCARPSPRGNVRPLLNSAHLPFSFPLPGFCAPVARGIARRLVHRLRQRFWVRPSRHRHQFSLNLERRCGRRRCLRGNHPRRRLQIHIGRFRNQAGVHANCMLLQLCNLRRGSRPSHSNRFRHEFVYQLVQAGLPAQMFRSRTQPVARLPSAHPQFAPLFIGNEPMVRLLLLRCADVARYCLPDHRISPSPHSLSAASSFPVPAPVVSTRANQAFRRPRRLSEWSSL